jgi:predicted GIY-YIG superfamily endonuclease
MFYYIYKIYPKDDITMLYIGSTNNFSRRKSQHKKNITNKVSKKYKTPLYVFIRSLGGWDNFNCEIVIKKEFVSKEEMLETEKYYITELNAKLNINKPI